MKVLKGFGAGGGTAEGLICIYTSVSESSIPHYAVEKQDIENEIRRLDGALSAAVEKIRKDISISGKTLGKDAENIFSAHLFLLTDKNLRDGIVGLIKDRSINAEHAVNDHITLKTEALKNMESHFRELVHDLQDVQDRLLASLSAAAAHFRCAVGEEKPVIVTARQLTPSMILNIPREHILAFVSKFGGLTSHATILARSLGVPVLIGVDIDRGAECGVYAIADGISGRLILSPDEKILSSYRTKIKNEKNRRSYCSIKKEMPAATGEGRRILLKLNINTPEECALAERTNADGIGLLRTEFLFRGKKTPPSEEEQLSMYKKLLSCGNMKEITVRMLDISSDKIPSFITVPEGTTDYAIRGARAAELFRKIYISQAKALLLANTGNLRVLFPMVSDLNDFRVFKSILSEAHKEILKEGKNIVKSRIPMGVMLETPAGIMMAEEILTDADFANIGTNDLYQYTLAASRSDEETGNRYHILHPSIVKLIRLAVEAGKKNGRETCLCGAAASFEEYYSVLLSTGLTSFSVDVGSFDTIKCELLHLNTTHNHDLKAFYKTVTADEIDDFIKNVRE